MLAPASALSGLRTDVDPFFFFLLAYDASARFRVDVPWVLRWQKPVTGALRISLEGCVMGDLCTPRQVKGADAAALRSPADPELSALADITELMTGSRRDSPSRDALWLFALLSQVRPPCPPPRSEDLQDSLTPSFHYTTDTLLQKKQATTTRHNSGSFQ